MQGMSSDEKTAKKGMSSVFLYVLVFQGMSSGMSSGDFLKKFKSILGNEKPLKT
jgi:hypothetical protein